MGQGQVSATVPEVRSTMWCDMGHCEMYNPVTSVSYPDDVGVLAWGVGRRQSGL